MKLHELTLSKIDAERHLSVSVEIVAAVCFAAQAGYGANTSHRFVTALVMLDYLRDRSAWPMVLRKIKNLDLDAQLATLESGRPVVGDIE